MKFTAENASHFAKLSHAPDSARNKPKPAPVVTAIETQLAESDPRRLRILEQIDLLDDDFAKSNAVLRVRITASKARLWELLYPKPGSLKPSRIAKRNGNSYPEPVPIVAQDTTTGSVPQQTPVEPSHKSEQTPKTE